MTRFEIVYFDATEPALNPEADAACQRLRATKGGKGLRLKDVAAGRKVFGHLPLSEITVLAIERCMPCRNQPNCDDSPAGVVPESEHWIVGRRHDSRDRVWRMVKQDRLAVHTAHGRTLYLRFYSDLDKSQALVDWRTDDPGKGDRLTRNNAFQWIQTLGRFCGREQLHQQLSHLGEGSEDELRDYLVVHQNGEQNRAFHFLANHGPQMRNHETVVMAVVKVQESMVVVVIIAAAALSSSNGFVDDDDDHDDDDEDDDDDDNVTSWGVAVFAVLVERPAVVFSVAVVGSLPGESSSSNGFVVMIVFVVRLDAALIVSLTSE
jgi:hypothetical protein